MHNDKLASDGGRNPAISGSGDVVCFGFLTYCLLMMVDELPPKNGGALVRDSVETVGDDAAIVASVLTNWRVPTRCQGRGEVGPLGCRRPAKTSSLTGQQKCHIPPMENVTLTPKEQTRLQVLNSLLAEHMTLDQAATLMGVGPRHTRRILAAYREKGAAAVAHGHRGRRPPNATPEAVATAAVHLARTRYAGANHTHL